MKHTVTVFKTITATSAGFYRDLTWVLDRIKSGHSKENVGLIRLEQDSSERNKLKMKLPSICFSGVFQHRSISGLKTHSGLICLDFDKFPDEDTMQTWRDTLEGDQYTLALFTSPSGNGLKVIVQIPAESENHKLYFDALKDHYDCEYFDIATSDVSRVCYESYDPDLIYNPEALLWTEKAQPAYEEISTVAPTIPLTSESRIINQLQVWWEGKYGANKGSRNNNIYKFAIALNDFGVDKMEAENHLGQYASDGFPVEEINKVIQSAYNKTSQFGSKQFEDHMAVAKVEKMVRSGRTVDHIKKEFPKLEKGEIESAIGSVKDTMAVTDYWRYDDKGNVKIIPHKYKFFLEQNQFFKFFPEGSNASVFVKIESNLLSETSPQRIKDFILDNLMERDDVGYKPWDYMAEQTKFFNSEYLSMLDTANVELMQDDADSCYLYYRNCALKVTKDNIEKIDYVDLDGFVWEHHVIDRDFTDTDEETGMYERFVHLIAGQDTQKIDSLRSVAGYLLHSYKNSGNNRAIIFNDETVTENPNGGSGKGLFCNGLGHMKRMTTLDGKQFSFDKTFAYQTVSPDTQLLLFDDIKKNFAFENTFSLITEGITIEKKNKDAIYIPVARSPKIIINTNYTIGGVGGSFERRKFEVELSSYFGFHHTPIDEFGCMFFDDWDEDEWRRFDTFMIRCEQFYLKNGLVAHEFNNLELRKFIKETSFEFSEWVKDEGNMEVNIRMDKAKKYADFQQEFKDFHWLSQRKFTSWIASYAKREGLKVEQGKSNYRWIMLVKEEDTQQGLEF